MDGTLRTLANQGYGKTNFRIVKNTVSSVSLDFTAVTSFITSVSPGLVRYPLVLETARFTRAQQVA